MVYIPHCGTSAADMFEEVRTAMLVAFGGSSAEDAAMRERILQCDTPESLIAFVNSLPARSLIFVLDQFNSLEEEARRPTASSDSERKTFCPGFVRFFLLKVNKNNICITGSGSSESGVADRNKSCCLIFYSRTYATYSSFALTSACSGTRRTIAPRLFCSRCSAASLMCGCTAGSLGYFSRGFELITN